MRKLSVVAVAAAAVFALAGVALAANVYTVDGSTKPSAKKAGKGTASKPVPVSLNFDYTVDETDESKRATPVERYYIGAEGLVTYPQAFKTCTYSQASQSDTASAKAACKKARVGGGVVHALAGPTVAPTVKLFCNLELNLYNLAPGNYGVAGKITKKLGGIAIRLDGDEKTVTNDKDIGCPIGQHTAIVAPYYATKIGGIKSEELRFTVPENLLHAAEGVDTSVRQTESAIKRIVGKAKVGGKKRSVGFYNSIGCKGKRTIRVTFVAENGQKSQKTKDGPC
jgi:hypothetical protein